MIDKIKVLHRTYSIFDMDKNDLAVNGHYGRSDHRLQKIYLDMSVVDNELADTLIHETLHCICNTMNIDKPKDEEEMVCAISHGLTTVFKDNPELLPEIIELLK